jgi:hypothetical protein
MAAASPLATATRDAVSSPHATMSELGREFRATMQHTEEHEQRRSFDPKIEPVTALTVPATPTVAQPSIAAPTAEQRLIAESREVHAVAMTPATLDELSRVRVETTGSEHHERSHRFGASVANGQMAITAPLVVASAAAALPPITRGFQAATNPLPGALSGLDPADASGAVGPHHVTGAFNNAVTVHDRNGNLLLLISAAQFWHDPKLTDQVNLYDPRVAYDAASDRWVILMLGDDASQQNGVLLIAFSATANPAGAWNRFRVPVDPNGKDGDLTHIAITADQIAVTVNAWTPNAQIYCYAFTMSKSATFSSPSLLTIYQTELPLADEQVPITSSDTTLRFASLASGGVVRVFDLAINGGFAGFANWREYPSPSSFSSAARCNQLGTSVLLDCGFPRLIDGTSRNGVVWLVEQKPQNLALVWRISGSAATTYVIQPPNLAVAYPSIAVNRNNAALVGYTITSSSIYPSAGYSYIDPAGNLSASGVVKNGEARFNGSRWGDFSTTVVDPLDDTSFWTIQEYATTPLSPNFDRWATWWSYIQIAPARTRAVHH